MSLLSDRSAIWAIDQVDSPCIGKAYVVWTARSGR